jgi:hypothetical protein
MRDLMMSERHTGRAMLTILLADPPPPWWAADLKLFKPYVYRGQGYDIFETEEAVTPDLLAGLDHSEIPGSCTCTWSWGPPAFRWARIGVKEDCPWHKAGDTLMAKVGQA